MEKWHQYFQNLRPRIDLRKNFYPEQLEPRRPALLSSGSLLATCLISARLLHTIAQRGGTRIKPTWTRKMCTLFEDALLPEAVVHCDEEVTRILEWLEGRAETLPPDQLEPETCYDATAPELDIMFAAELESRLSVVHFALAEDFDLQLEYYDEQTDSWPRLRATPLEIHHINPENTPDADAPANNQSILLSLLTSEQQSCTIPLKSIRWLMPVTRQTPEPEKPAPPKTPRQNPGRLLNFPNVSHKTDD